MLRAGEIMDSVKCAMVAFIHEREQLILSKRKDDHAKLESGKCPDDKERGSNGNGRGPELCQIEGRFFGPYHINADASPFPTVR